jgi:cholesterol transport system auxiliary component
MNALRCTLAAALVAGCSALSPPRPPPAREELNSWPQDIPHVRQRDASIIVLPPEAGTEFGTTRIVYSQAPFQTRDFRDHEWAEPPPQMIQGLLVKTLEGTGAFRSVLTPPDPARGAYTLRTMLSELVQDYAVSPPLARVRMRVELLNPSGQQAASRDVAIEERMPAATADAGVAATNAAVSKALAAVAGFAVESAR